MQKQTPYKMPKLDVAPITAWSFSRLQDYQKCPRLAYFKHVVKMREEQGPALLNGQAVHKEAEVFMLNGARKKVPESLKTLEPFFRAWQKRKNVEVELEWTFDRSWNDLGDWFSKLAYCRIKVDVSSVDVKRNVLEVKDYKTGNWYDYHDKQLGLYGLGGLAAYPLVDAVEVAGLYNRDGKQIPEKPAVYTRDQLPSLIKFWDKEAKPMLTDKRFAPKPSSECRRCFASRSKGGPCEF